MAAVSFNQGEPSQAYANLLMKTQTMILHEILEWSDLTKKANVAVKGYKSLNILENLPKAIILRAKFQLILEHSYYKIACKQDNDHAEGKTRVLENTNKIAKNAIKKLNKLKEWQCKKFYGDCFTFELQLLKGSFYYDLMEITHLLDNINQSHRYLICGRSAIKNLKPFPRPKYYVDKDWFEKQKQLDKLFLKFYNNNLKQLDSEIF